MGPLTRLREGRAAARGPPPASARISPAHRPTQVSCCAWLMTVTMLAPGVVGLASFRMVRVVRKGMV